MDIETPELATGVLKAILSGEWLTYLLVRAETVPGDIPPLDGCGVDAWVAHTTETGQEC